MQLPGQPLALFQGSLAAGLGEQPGVLHRHRRLVRHGPQENLLVFAGFMIGEVSQVDRTESPSPRDERHDVDDVPRSLADEVVNRSVEIIIQDVPADTTDQHGLPRLDGPHGG